MIDPSRLPVGHLTSSSECLRLLAILEAKARNPEKHGVSFATLQGRIQASIAPDPADGNRTLLLFWMKPLHYSEGLRIMFNEVG